MSSSITASLLTFPEKDYPEEGEIICYRNISKFDFAVLTSLEERLDRTSILKYKKNVHILLTRIII